MHTQHWRDTQTTWRQPRSCGWILCEVDLKWNQIQTPCQCTFSLAIYNIHIDGSGQEKKKTRQKKNYAHEKCETRVTNCFQLITQWAVGSGQML